MPFDIAFYCFVGFLNIITVFVLPLGFCPVLIATYFSVLLLYWSYNKGGGKYKYFK